MKNLKTKMLFVSLATFLTVVARSMAVERRLSMGLDPSWGGEFAIPVLFLILYLVYVADWSLDI